MIDYKRCERENLSLLWRWKQAFSYMEWLRGERKQWNGFGWGFCCFAYAGSYMESESVCIVYGSSNEWTGKHWFWRSAWRSWAGGRGMNGAETVGGNKKIGAVHNDNGTFSLCILVYADCSSMFCSGSRRCFSLMDPYIARIAKIIRQRTEPIRCSRWNKKLTQIAPSDTTAMLVVYGNPLTRKNGFVS